MPRQTDRIHDGRDRMTVADREGSGPLTTVLAEDHRRLDALLHSATSAADHIDQAVYDQFRAGC